MKTLIAFALVALAFTTGFTCSKNAPEQAAPATTTEAPAQDQMAATTTAPAEAAPSTTAAPAQ